MMQNRSSIGRRPLAPWTASPGFDRPSPGERGSMELSSEEVRSSGPIRARIATGGNARDGDAEVSEEEKACSIAEFVQAHEPALRGYLRSRFSVLPDVDDIVQEAYLRVWKARWNGRNRRIRSLIFTTARNVALDTVRRLRVAPFEDVSREYASSVADDHRGVVETVSRRQEIGLLAAAVAALPPRCRETLTLQRMEGLTYKEVARRLGVSENTVSNRVQQGIRRCTEYLESGGPRE